MDDDGAARWAIRRDAGPLSSDEQREFDAWIAADERREGALLRAEAALIYIAGDPILIDAESGPAALEEEAPAPSRFGRRHFLAGGAAAVAAGVAGVLLMPSGQEYSTTVGEVRRLPLADGSVATVNTASRIAVALEPERRHITLEEGEAWFQVAHDAHRPFVVDVGAVRVRAVGTAFSVRRNPEGVDVLVTEGVVETWIEGNEAARTRIARGERSFVATGTQAIVAVKAADEIDRALAWRDGGLALNGEPLSYAVAELNRYNHRKLVVEDPVLARMPIVGYFRTDEPGDFARAVAPLVGARVEMRSGDMHLVATGS
ncbi:Fe2+-dicitrate sensor, membrane component [uncultured Sphingopyxis sp.]|uniref:Fe2+-dicitrate sensor, membrane component n=1 Tax=uncultured Sphingopyxis sp. TaxID=310581 RepID=A0A1Y5PWZ4_9SPHN|nr:FecR domain-containing protein [uncultured Sphingopyxis sp.]SBV34528.1 Fe2+-dicitrate sensor, membrane component [uncultured Sphingopyxis sp.]